MKVRRKVNPYREWIVKEESTSFYIAYDGDSDPMALPKADYEPVEEWVDVTHTVKFGTYSGLMDYRDKDYIVDSEMNGVGYILAGKDGVSITMKGVWQEEFKMEMVNGAIRVYERKGA